MSKTAHRIFIFSLVIIVLVVLALLWYKGVSFYKTTIEERFFHSDYKSLKPSGIIGHGYGILGSFFMLMGVMLYMLRKRFRTFSRLGILKHWLEFHIFLCTLGPILVLFHTSFKFGGIVAISFWSMIAVFLSGIIGRFIYIQIPRTIEGRELSLSEVMNLKTDVGGVLKNANLDEESIKEILELTKQKDRSSLKKAKLILSNNNVAKIEYNNIVDLLKNEISLNRKIDRLSTMQNLLKYWHVAHLPFAFVMLIVMIVHVIVTITFGAKWIF